ncbi:hypothetical protein OROHE_008301 [Orobanche hederae]
MQTSILKAKYGDIFHSEDQLVSGHLQRKHRGHISKHFDVGEVTGDPGKMAAVLRNLS